MPSFANNPALILLGFVASAIAVALLSSPASAQDANNAAEPKNTTRQALEQKITLLEKLVVNSPSAHRVDKSANQQAIQKLNDAENALSEAKRLLDEGLLTQAQQSVDNGLRSVAKASQLVIDRGRFDERNLEQYRQLRQRVESFTLAFSKLVDDRGESAQKLLDRAKLQTLVENAEKLSADHNYVGAISALNNAADMVERALVEARRSETVVYSLSFDTPEDEYEYEWERNRSHQELVNLLIQQRQPEPSTVRLINELLEQNSSLISMAQSLAEKGRYNKAIRTMEEGTGQLIQALRLGGLNLVPTQ